MQEGLKRLISYYGSKWRLAPRYPAPDHDTIVEPFAGGAGYSLLHYDRNVMLVERNEKLAAVWEYLIRSSAAEILALPLLESGQSTNDLQICQEARWLIGWWLRPSSFYPYTRWPHSKSPSDRRVDNPATFWGVATRARVAAQVEHISHWKIYCCSYDEAPVQDRKATWFVDPPYIGKVGSYYKYGSGKLDYAQLSEWCRSRRGQVIVCENEGADWLPFRVLADDVQRNNMATRPKRAEMIWANERWEPRHDDDSAQLEMFGGPQC